MADIKTFKSYNFVTGAVDGTQAYDFSHPGLYREEEYYSEPAERRRRRERVQPREWIKEDARTRARANTAVKNAQGIPVLSILGVAVAAVLLALTLLAQIRLTDISYNAAELEDQISELKLQNDKLTVEYETVFNLKDVEAIAVDELGMQEPMNEQIYYLTGVASADKAEVVTKDGADMFSLGLSDIFRAIRAYGEALGIF